MSLQRSLFSKISRKLHLWAGILFSPLLIMLAITGIGLNHPSLIKSLSIPMGVMPEDYHYDNWNRGLVEAIIPDGEGGYYATGKEGVWSFSSKGAEPLSNPLQDSAWKRMGYSLYLDQSSDQLISGARDGLYSLDLATNQWALIQGSLGERFVSIIADSRGLLAMSRKALYRLEFSDSRYQLAPIPIQLADNGRQSPLFRFIFQLHSGELLGWLGILVMDMTAGLLLFLSISALYMFIYPRLVKYKWLSRKRRIAGGRRFRWMLLQHNRWGLIIALVLLISGGTGMLMRPPGLILIASGSSPVKLDEQHGGPLSYILEKALWDPQQGALMLLTSGGLYLGQPQSGVTFTHAGLPVPVHPMGATLFQHMDDVVAVGSFSGIYRWEPQTDRVGFIALETGRTRMMPKALLQESGDLALFDFYTGLNYSSGSSLQLPEMPKAINNTASISLWHMFFELHNMRVFQAFIGPFYLLLVALTGLVLVLVSLSGVYDYLVKKKRNRARIRLNGRQS